MESDRRRKTASAADASMWAAPTDVAAERIDPDVITALSRWRHVDPHSLGDLSSVLTTHTGLFAGDSAGYLSALHGFVAEQISYDALSHAHDVVMPDATTVPAWDLLVDGRAVQIKEGITADAAVHHALERYPQYREFITDPAAAARLRAEGIDAQGVPGLEPSQIADHTANSLEGLRELDLSGTLHIPVLTAIYATFRYWERMDEGTLDARTALRLGAARGQRVDDGEFTRLRDARLLASAGTLPSLREDFFIARFDDYDADDDEIRGRRSAGGSIGTQHRDDVVS